MTSTPDQSDHETQKCPATSGVIRPNPLQRSILLAIGCGFVYLLIVGSFGFDFKQTSHPHHILMADAMLHGRFHISRDMYQYKWEQTAAQIAQWVADYERSTGEVLTPAQQEAVLRGLDKQKASADWAVFDDKLYGYWAPLTSVLMIPFVALFGIGVSDQLINVLFGALNIGLFYCLLHRVDRLGLCRMNEACRLALTLLLAFGTSHFWLTCAAQVWFSVQIVTLTMLLAAILVACAAGSSTVYCLWSGILFGAALLGRNIVILVGLFFVLLFWIQSRQQISHWLRDYAGRLTLFVIPVVLAIGVQGAYNYARFGDVLESGLDIQIRTGGHSRFLESYERYGKFSPHYVPHNLKYYFWNYDLPRKDGRIWFDVEGNSLFLVTPPLVYIFLAWRRKNLFTLALLGGILPLTITLMLYFATGFAQFGPRYLLDVMPLLLLLAATGLRGKLTHVGYVLIILAVAANLFGTYRMCEGEFVPIQRWITYLTLPTLVAIALLARILVIRRPADRSQYLSTE